MGHKRVWCMCGGCEYQYNTASPLGAVRRGRDGTSEMWKHLWRFHQLTSEEIEAKAKAKEWPPTVPEVEMHKTKRLRTALPTIPLAEQALLQENRERRDTREARSGARTDHMR